MAEPGATAGASLTASNGLDLFAAHLAAEEQTCAKQSPRSSSVFTFVSCLNYIPINYQRKQEEAACPQGPNQFSPVKESSCKEKAAFPTYGKVWNHLGGKLRIEMIADGVKIATTTVCESL